MKKTTRTTKTFLTISLMLTSILYVVSIALAAPATPSDIPEIIEINTQAIAPPIPGLPKDKKQVKSFNHRQHATEYLPGNSEFSSSFSDDFTCKACHLQADTPESINSTPASVRLTESLDKNGGPNSLKKYFHNICLTCHKNMKKAKKTTGPTSCKGCHKRS